ncbi:unnamed protein product [Ixodes pacificus]
MQRRRSQGDRDAIAEDGRELTKRTSQGRTGRKKGGRKTERPARQMVTRFKKSPERKRQSKRRGSDQRKKTAARMTAADQRFTLVTHKRWKKGTEPQGQPRLTEGGASALEKMAFEDLRRSAKRWCSDCTRFGDPELRISSATFKPSEHGGILRPS